MEIAERGYTDVSGRYVCDRCLTPEAHGVLASRMVEEEPCTFCAAAGPTVDFEFVMEKFMHMVGLLYGDAHAQGTPLMDGEYLGKTWYGEEIADLHSGLVLTHEGAIAFAREALKGADRIWAYRDDLEPPDEAMKYSWSDLASIVKYQQRYIFLSQEDRIRPDELSPRQYLEKLDRIIHDNAVTHRLPKGSELYRVRPYAGRREFDLVAAEIGSPPAHLAKPNRMSPAGISMFYGSENLDTAIAETTGSTVPPLAVGRWETTRDLHLVDLTKSLPLANFFVAAHGTAVDLETYFNVSYLRQFTREIAKPVDPTIPNIEYVPTQIVTEYLRFTRGGTYDGIRFHSAKDGQPNYVLFADGRECADRGKCDRFTKIELVEAYDKLP